MLLGTLQRTSLVSSSSSSYTFEKSMSMILITARKTLQDTNRQFVSVSSSSSLQRYNNTNTIVRCWTPQHRKNGPTTAAAVLRTVVSGNNQRAVTTRFLGGIPTTTRSHKYSYNNNYHHSIAINNTKSNNVYDVHRTVRLQQITSPGATPSILQRGRYVSMLSTLNQYHRSQQSTSTITTSSSSSYYRIPKIHRPFNLYNNHPTSPKFAVALGGTTSQQQQQYQCFFSGSNNGPSRFPQVKRQNGNPFNGGGDGNRDGNDRQRFATGIGMLGAASVLFGKTKYLFAAMKLTKLASLGSMVLSIGAYSLLFGWPYAIGMVGLIFCHECGHLLMMVNRGVPFSPMVFIPFMGAVIAMKDQPRDAWEDAIIAAGGPIAGTMASCVVAMGANATDSQLLYALADFGYMINLFNLLPIGSLDGGRWAGALSKYFGVAGVGFGGYLAYTGVVGNPLFYIILLAGGYETFQRFYDPFYVAPNYYKITTTQRAVLTGGYFGLVAFLLYAMDTNHRRQKPPDVIAREHGTETFWDSSDPF